MATEHGSIATSGNSLDLQLTTVDKVVMARDPLSAIGHEEGDHLGTTGVPLILLQ